MSDASNAAYDASRHKKAGRGHHELIDLGLMELSTREEKEQEDRTSMPRRVER